MPSKENINDVLAVEELVHEIKENLRLKARPSHNHGRNSRPSPYHIPCRSWNEHQHHPSINNQHQMMMMSTTNPAGGNNSFCTNCNSNMIGCGSTTSTTTTSSNFDPTSTTMMMMCCNNCNNSNTNLLINNTNSEKLHFNNSTSNNYYNHHQNQMRCNCKNCHKTNKTNSVDDIDDPYELLQALLKNQNLVKEAVRRLQLNLSPKQKSYFYESDDDGSTSPIYGGGRVCQLEL